MSVMTIPSIILQKKNVQCLLYSSVLYVTKKVVKGHDCARKMGFCSEYQYVTFKIATIQDDSLHVLIYKYVNRLFYFNFDISLEILACIHIKHDIRRIFLSQEFKETIANNAFFLSRTW